MFEKAQINKKEAGVGPFFLKKTHFNTEDSDSKSVEYCFFRFMKNSFLSLKAEFFNRL